MALQNVCFNLRSYGNVTCVGQWGRARARTFEAIVLYFSIYFVMIVFSRCLFGLLTALQLIMLGFDDVNKAADM